MQLNSSLTHPPDNFQVNILDFIPNDIRQFLYNGNSKARRVSINAKEWKNLLTKIVASFINGTNPIDEFSEDLKVRIYAEATEALEGIFEPAEFFNLINETFFFIHSNKTDTSKIKHHLQTLDKMNSSRMSLLLAVLKYCITEAEKSDKKFSYCRILIDVELKNFMIDYEISKKVKQNHKASVSMLKENMTLSEAAEYLSLSESYLYKLTSNRTIQFSKPGGKVIYFKRKVLDEFILRNPIKHHRLLETESNTIAAIQRAKKK